MLSSAFQKLKFPVGNCCENWIRLSHCHHRRLHYRDKNQVYFQHFDTSQYNIYFSFLHFLLD